MKDFENMFEDFILVRYNEIYPKIEEKEEYKKASTDVIKKHTEILKKLKILNHEDLMEDITILLDLINEREDIYIKELYKFAFSDGLYFKEKYKDKNLMDEKKN